MKLITCTAMASFLLVAIEAKGQELDVLDLSDYVTPSLLDQLGGSPVFVDFRTYAGSVSNYQFRREFGDGQEFFAKLVGNVYTGGGFQFGSSLTMLTEDKSSPVPNVRVRVHASSYMGNSRIRVGWHFDRQPGGVPKHEISTSLWSVVPLAMTRLAVGGLVALNPSDDRLFAAATASLGTSIGSSGAELSLGMAAGKEVNAGASENEAGLFPKLTLGFKSPWLWGFVSAHFLYAIARRNDSFNQEFAVFIDFPVFSRLIR